MSTTREALSRSMANLDFNPDQGKRRARTQRSKRDLSASCSAFNFVLDKDEMQQVAGSGKGGRASGRSGSSGATNKPSYSDLIMDATSKSAYHLNSNNNNNNNNNNTATTAKSPTSVLAEEGESDIEAEEESERHHQQQPHRTSDTTNESGNSRGSRSFKSAGELREFSSGAGAQSTRNLRGPRQRGVARSKSTNASSSFFRHTREGGNLRSSTGENTTSNTSDTNQSQLSPGGRARRNRMSRDANRGSRSNNTAGHMSMMDFPQPSEFATEPMSTEFSSQELTLSPERRTPRSPRRTRSAAQKASKQFSKSFSGFDDWNPESDIVTYTRRKGGKRPTRASSHDKTAEQEFHSADFAAFPQEELTTQDLLSAESSTNNHHHNSFSESQQRQHSSFSQAFDNSLSEMDLFNVGGEGGGSGEQDEEQEQDEQEHIKPLVKKKSSRSKSSHGNSNTKKDISSRRQSQQARNDRFAKSFSCFDVKMDDLVSTTSGSSSTTADEPVVVKTSSKARRKSSHKLDPIDFFATTAADPNDTDAATVATEVETEKVSADEFMQQEKQQNSWSAQDDSGEFFGEASKAPSTRKPRNRRDGNHRSSSSRQNSAGPRLRRTQTDATSNVRSSRSGSNESFGRNHQQHPNSPRRSRQDKERTRSSSTQPEKATSSGRASSKGPDAQKRHRASSKDRQASKRSSSTQRSSSTKRSSSKEAARRTRRASQRDMRRGSQGPGTHMTTDDNNHHRHRSTSRDRKTRRRRSIGVDSDHGIEIISDNPVPQQRRMPRRKSNPDDDHGVDGATGSPPQRRAPRRTRSSDGSSLNPMRDQSTATTATAATTGGAGRRGPRRAKSTDGGITFVRRGSTGGVEQPSSLQKSLSNIMLRESGGDDPIPSKSFSGGDTVVSSSTRDSGGSAGSGGSAVKSSKSRTTAAPRRKTPQRARSQDFSASMTFSRRTTRERGGENNGKQEGRRQRSNSSKDLVAASRADRRAMAHKILNE